MAILTRHRRPTVTIRDVARRAGVSYTTVSLAFQPNSRISSRRRQQILEIADDLGYTPNRSARALKGASTRTIGVLVNDITNPFYALIVRAAHLAAGARGYEILIVDSRWEPDHELAEVRRMISARVDGLLACFGRRPAASIKLLRDEGIPHIALDARPENYRGAYVVNDIAAAARVGAEHLLEIGCRRIVFFDADAKNRSFVAFQQLCEQFVQTLRSRGAQCDDLSVVAAGLDIESGFAAMTQLHRDDPTVDGVLCANSLCALGAMEAAARLGLSVPKDVAFVGIDDLDICRLDRVSLTALRQPYEQLAKLATNILVEAIEHRTVPNLQVSLQPELIARGSTRRE